MRWRGSRTTGLEIADGIRMVCGLQERRDAHGEVRQPPGALGILARGLAAEPLQQPAEPPALVALVGLDRRELAGVRQRRELTPEGRRLPCLREHDDVVRMLGLAAEPAEGVASPPAGPTLR